MFPNGARRGILAAVTTTRPAVLVRPYDPSDVAALRDVCVRTGADGGDARGLFRRPDLLHVAYLDPYLEHSPDLVRVADDGAPVGYVVGVADTEAFEDWCAEHWWPPLRDRLPEGADVDPATDPDPDAWLLRLPHDPPRTPAHLLADHPAHLHVDLLPHVQGAGHGRRLLGALFDALRERGVPGVHLGASVRNTRAIGFYRHLGFRALGEGDGVVHLGLDLS